MIRVEKVKNRIWVKSPYQYRDVCKSIPGHNWSKKNKVWTFPLSMPVCRDLRAAFGKKLEIGPDLLQWAKIEVEREKLLHEIASSSDISLENVPRLFPNIAEAVENRPYQKIGIRWMKEAKRALLADQPGLGKTVQTLGTIIEAEITGPIIIFAPKTAALATWPEEIEKWLPGDTYFALSGLGTSGRDQVLDSIYEWSISPLAYRDRLWVICNIEMARRPKSPMFKIEWAGMVVDESHRALVTTKPKGHTLQRQGLAELSGRPDHIRIALSGTPMRGKPQNLWGTFNWLWPEKYPSYWQWAMRRYEAYQDGYGIILGDLDPSRIEEFEAELQVMMLRRTKEEVLPQLPPKMYAGRRLPHQVEAAPPGHWIPMSSEQKKIYDQMVKHATAELEGGSLSAIGVLAEMTRLKQFASSSGYIDGTEFKPCLPSNKFDWLVQFLTKQGITGDEEEFGDGKVIVASQFTQLLKLFHSELSDLGIVAHILTGETPVHERKRIVNEFQSPGGPRVFMLNTKAGGVSVTLDAADDVVILDETWVPDDQEQVEDRAHRTSRIHQVRIHYVRSLETIEEEIATRLGDMEHIQKSLMDGTRGVEIAKMLIGE